ncbi:MAG: hypothetical protein U0269_08590 [Polyangiales bacterium]
MAEKGRTALGQPSGRGRVLVAGAVVVSMVVGAIATGFGRIGAAIVATVYALYAVFFFTWWRQQRGAMKLRAAFESDPQAARLEVDRTVATKKRELLFDGHFWRIATLDAFTNGDLDRYALLSSEALRSRATIGGTGLRARRALCGSSAFANALAGRVEASREALDAWSRSKAEADAFDDSVGAIVVAHALWLLRAGHLDQAREYVRASLPAVLRSTREVRVIALAMLTARSGGDRPLPHDRGGSRGAGCALDAALESEFPAFCFAPTLVAPLTVAQRSMLEPAVTEAPLTLPDPIESRPEPPRRAPLVWALGLVCLAFSWDFEALTAAAFTLGLLGLAVWRVEARAHPNESDRQRRQLVALKRAVWTRANTDVRGELEWIARNADNAISSRACALLCDLALDDGQLGAAQTWAERCLARLDSESALDGEAWLLRADAVRALVLCRAARGEFDEAERYAGLFDERSELQRESIAILRLLRALREGRDDLRAWAELCATVSLDAYPTLLAHAALAIDDPAHEDFVREALARWPSGRAWLDAVAPSLATRFAARTRVDPAPNEAPSVQSTALDAPHDGVARNAE